MERVIQELGFDTLAKQSLTTEYVPVTTYAGSEKNLEDIGNEGRVPANRGWRRNIPLFLITSPYKAHRMGSCRVKGS